MRILNVTAALLLPLLVSSWALGASGAAGEPSLSLGLGAIPQMDIVTSVHPSPQEANAAAELKHYLSRIVGGDFVSSDEAGVRHNAKAIYVGRTLALWVISSVGW